MHVESSKSNFLTQKSHSDFSGENTRPLPCPSYADQGPEHWEDQATGLSSCRPLVPSSFEGSGNVTPPAWQGQALFSCGSAHRVSLASEMTLCHLVRPDREIMVQPCGWAGFAH